MTDPYQSAVFELARLLEAAREKLVAQVLDAGLTGRLTFATPARKPTSALSYEYLLHDGLAVGLVEAVLEDTVVKVRTAFGCP